MDGKAVRNFGASLLAAVLLGACGSTPTKIQFPTPNWTMSKLFEVPTAKPRGQVPTASQTAPAGGGTAGPSATISPTAPDCTNLAQFVSGTVPDRTVMLPGAAFLKTWTLKNIGTCQWGRGYALVFDRGDRMDGPETIPLTASVPPGAVYNFAVNLTAPATEGEFQGYWLLQTPQGLRFGVEPGGNQPLGVVIVVSKSPGCAPQDRRPDQNGLPIPAVNTVTPPVLDGNLTEWENPLPYAITAVVSGDTDNSARFGLRWDSSYLYIAVKVADNTYVQETSGGANLYKGDSLEILLDANLQGDYCDSLMSPDDYQLGISPGYLQDPSLQPPAAYLWYPVGRKGPQTITIAALLTRSPDPNGWIVELKIPWVLFGISPRGGETYGFALSVSDNDTFGTVAQRGMISTSPRRTSPTNPALWGTLRIIGSSGT
jgi:hypothetical protein